jgi:hypothetical protein
MFEAMIIVCAVNFAQEIMFDTCIQTRDTWGPYITEENCAIRANQMSKEVLEGELNPLFFDYYAAIGINAAAIYVEGFCEDII